MYLFVNGVVAGGCVAVGFLFMRFLRSTRDPLFLYFALAFWLLAIERLVLSMVNAPETSTPSVYLLRLAAFLSIIVGIVAKNVPSRR